MGLRSFFLTNFPEAMFIQGNTFIPDSRVIKLMPLYLSISFIKAARVWVIYERPFLSLHALEIRNV
jgi:hypothetical protein